MGPQDAARLKFWEKETEAGGTMYVPPCIPISLGSLTVGIGWGLKNEKKKKKKKYSTGFSKQKNKEPVRKNPSARGGLKGTLTYI